MLKHPIHCVNSSSYLEVSAHVSIRALLVAAAFPFDIISKNRSTTCLSFTIPLRNFPLNPAEPHPPTPRVRMLTPHGSIDPKVPGEAAGSYSAGVGAEGRGRLCVLGYYKCIDPGDFSGSRLWLVALSHYFTMWIAAMNPPSMFSGAITGLVRNSDTGTMHSVVSHLPESVFLVAVKDDKPE